MRIAVLFLLAALVGCFGEASCQTVFDVWKSSTRLDVGVLAEASVTVAAQGEDGGGKITLRCQEDEGTTITISATEGVGRGKKPWRKVRLKFDSAPFFDKDWLHAADTAKALQPEHVAYFIETGRKAASLYITVTNVDGKRVDLPNFPMYGFKDALGVFPAECVP